MAPQSITPGEGEVASAGGDRGRLEEDDRRTLREVARRSIEHGLEMGRPLAVDAEGFPLPLRKPGATFVTLNREGRLRGCVGSLEPRRPLVSDVAHNAFAAAFHDYRFPPLRSSELEDLEIHISLLTPQVPLEVGSREELIESLRPGVDGLVVEDGPYRATFLPQVWDSLPEPERFVGELFLKAGLPRDHWSPSVRFHRYTVEEF